MFIDAGIKSDDGNYTGVAGNISEEGVYLRIRSAGAELYFAPGTIFDLSLKLPLERTICLRCRLAWAYEIPLATQPGRSSYNMGMEIMNTVPEYKKLYKDEAMNNFNDQLKSVS